MDCQIRPATGAVWNRNRNRKPHIWGFAVFETQNLKPHMDPEYACKWNPSFCERAYQKTKQTPNTHKKNKGSNTTPDRRKRRWKQQWRGRSWASGQGKTRAVQGMELLHRKWEHRFISVQLVPERLCAREEFNEPRHIHINEPLKIGS